jgi:phosphoglycolate phosphatase
MSTDTLSNSFDAIVFDLDGTLWDTTAACARGWQSVVERRQISFRPITPDDVRKVMGKPHEVCIRETFAGLPETVLQTLIEDTMIEDNLAVRRYGADLYDGVANGLKTLASRHPLFVVSNCQSGYIEVFIELYAQDVIVDFECWGNTGRPKTENLRALIQRNDLKKPLMVGDMESDRLAARHCGIAFYHAAYGFGQVTECDRRLTQFLELL